MSEHLYTYIDPPNPRHIEQVVDVLGRHGVIAIPAGTNWVFAADPKSKKALARFHRIKPDRPTDRPFALLCTDIAMANGMAEVDSTVYKALKRIWPGPYTVLLRSGRQLPKLLATKRKVVGVRVPEDPLAMLIVEAFGGPLLITTVPRHDNGEHRTLGYEVAEAFGNDVDLVVDLGEPLSGDETTVLDLSEGDVTIIRQGAGDTSMFH